MSTSRSPNPFAIPAVVLRATGADVEVTTLDGALAFAETNPHYQGDYDGLIRRLQSAVLPEDCTEAANAFIWWAEANGILRAGPGEERARSGDPSG